MKARHNDTERAQWIDNDEGLYDLWKASGQTKRMFIREHREMIDDVIEQVTSGARPAHYLTMGVRRRRRQRWRRNPK